MNKSVTFGYVLFFIVVILSNTISATDICRRSTLLKRNEDKVCSCSVARSVFGNERKGLIIASQNEQGHIKFTGKFFSGLPSTGRQSIKILDGCDNLIKDVTDDFDIQGNDDGSSEFFSALITDLSLDCGDNAIFFPSSSNCTCAGSNKREPPDPKFNMDTSEASITQI